MFNLASPWVLAALPLPILIWFLIPRAKVHLARALEVPFFKGIAKEGSVDTVTLWKNTNLILPALIWILTLVALAGPRWIGAPQPLQSEGYNIMMVLDLSGSMEIRDMIEYGRPAMRLSIVKREATEFVKERSGDKVGLILFGSRAYLQTPLTYDRHSVLERINDATAGLAGKTTSIGDALGLAVKHLQPVPSKGRMIILLTDGANNSGVLLPLKAAELAKEQGIKVYTIGLGADSNPQALGDNFLMPLMSADLDEKTLKKIAEETGGKYFRATDPSSLKAIYNAINQMEKVTQEEATVRPQKDYYPWVLALSFALFFYWIARRVSFHVG